MCTGGESALAFDGFVCCMRLCLREVAVQKCRVGRTARLGRTGEAVLFLQPKEADYLRELQQHGVVLKKAGIGGLWLSGEREGVAGESGTAQMHSAAVAMQKGLEAFVSKQVGLPCVLVAVMSDGRNSSMYDRLVVGSRS